MGFADLEEGGPGWSSAQMVPSSFHQRQHQAFQSSPAASEWPEGAGT